MVMCGTILNFSAFFLIKMNMRRKNKVVANSEFGEIFSIRDKKQAEKLYFKATFFIYFTLPIIYNCQLT